MMRPAAVLIGALALSACSPPAASSSPSVESAGKNQTAATRLAEPRRTEVKKGNDMPRTEMLITTDRAQLRAQLADNDSARALAEMLPLQIRMRDHLRQEKTGVLPSALPEGERQVDFSVGTLGLWGDRDFVIYYGKGRVPAPGIVILGQVTGDLSQFDNADRVTVSLRPAE
jgi:hypothetical protein